MIDETTATFIDGAYCTAKHARRVLGPLFEKGKIPAYPGATAYAVCYSELCAYDGDRLLAVWSDDMPEDGEGLAIGRPGPDERWLAQKLHPR